MLTNLINALNANKITRRELANKLGITERVIYYKLKGKGEFTASEMFKIQETYFPDSDLKELFKKF